MCPEASEASGLLRSEARGLLRSEPRAEGETLRGPHITHTHKITHRSNLQTCVWPEAKGSQARISLEASEASGLLRSSEAKREACSEAKREPKAKTSEAHTSHTHTESPTDGTHIHVYGLRRKAHRQGCHSGPENCVSTQLVLLTRGPVKANDVQKRVLLTRVPSRQRATPNCCTTESAHRLVLPNYINNQEDAGDWADFFYSCPFCFPYQFLQGFRRLGRATK